jgi:hypothetical protein
VDKWNTFIDSLAELGIKLGWIFAGIAGAIVSLPKQKTLTLIERLIVVFSGGAIANYLTPVFSEWTNAGENTRYGMAFLLGYLGLKSIELLIARIKNLKPTENGKD